MMTDDEFALPLERPWLVAVASWVYRPISRLAGWWEQRSAARTRRMLEKAVEGWWWS